MIVARAAKDGVIACKPRKLVVTAKQVDLIIIRRSSQNIIAFRGLRCRLVLNGDGDERTFDIRSVIDEVAKAGLSDELRIRREEKVFRKVKGPSE